MPKPYSLILFDLDGTLIDSRKDIVDSANRMLKAMSLPQKTEKEIAAFVGHGLGNLLIDCIGHENKDRADEALKFFKKDYEEHMLDETKLFPGVEHVLNNLENAQNIVKVVVTNKPLYYSEKILKSFEIFSKFDLVLGGDMDFPRKPEPDCVYYLLKEFKVKKENAIIIGDSLVDVRTGKNAGIQTCAMTYGFGSLASLEQEQPDYLLDSFSELLKII